MHTVLMCSLSTSKDALAIMDALKAAGIPPEHLSLSTNTDPGTLPPFAQGKRSFTVTVFIDALVSAALGAVLGVYIWAICKLVPDLEPFNGFDPLSIVEATTGVAAILGVVVSCLKWQSGVDERLARESGKPDAYVVSLHPTDEHESEVARDVVMASGKSEIVQTTEPDGPS